jgi:hypothetical protein
MPKENKGRKLFLEKEYLNYVKNGKKQIYKKFRFLSNVGTTCFALVSLQFEKILLQAFGIFQFCQSTLALSSIVDIQNTDHQSVVKMTENVDFI